MGRLLLVRHGATPWNGEGRIQGHTDTSLSEKGRWQVERLAARLAPLVIDATFSSDLARSQETAQLLLGRRGVRPHVLPALRELNYGEWEGRTYQELQVQDAERYARLITGDTAFAPPGGESVQDLVQRVRQVQEQLCQSAQGEKNALVVAHGGSLRALLVLLLGLPVASFWRFKVVPASLSIISLYPDGATLDLWSDTGHLEVPHGS